MLSYYESSTIHSTSMAELAVDCRAPLHDNSAAALTGMGQAERAERNMEMETETESQAYYSHP